MPQLFAKVGGGAGEPDGRSDFDFFFGTWRVAHRRLRERLVGSMQWETFEGACECRPIIGGQGNVDDNWIDLPDGAYRAATFRLFDPATRQWSIWWADPRRGDLDEPVKGAFKTGVGTFTCDDLFDGKPILVRFIWSGISADAAKWEQAFSPDNGKTWETNWEMLFTRQ